MPRCRIWETKTLKIVMRDFAYILGRNFNSGIVFLNNGCKTPVKNGLHTEKAALSVLLVFVSSIAAKISSTFQKNFLLFIIYYFKKGSGVTSVTIVVFNTRGRLNSLSVCRAPSLRGGGHDCRHCISDRVAVLKEHRNLNGLRPYMSVINLPLQLFKNPRYSWRGFRPSGVPASMLVGQVIRWPE